MGICQYCSQDAGFLRHVHAACESSHQEQVRQHDAATAEAAGLVAAYAEYSTDRPTLVAKLRDLAARQSIPPDEMHGVFVRGWWQTVQDPLANGLTRDENLSIYGHSGR